MDSEVEKLREPLKALILRLLEEDAFGPVNASGNRVAELGDVSVYWTCDRAHHSAGGGDWFNFTAPGREPVMAIWPLMGDLMVHDVFGDALIWFLAVGGLS